LVGDGDLVKVQTGKMGKQLRETHGQYSVSEARHRGTHRLMLYSRTRKTAPPQMGQSHLFVRQYASDS